MDLYGVILDELDNVKEDIKKFAKDKNTYKPGTTCPRCGKIQCGTADSRYVDGFQQRRRKCENCGHKWNTIEIRV